MTGTDPDADGGANEEPTLTTLIDGEEARLLVHIEPIDDAGAGPRTADEPPTMGQEGPQRRPAALVS